MPLIVERTSVFFDGPGPIYDLRMGRDGALYYLTSRELDFGANELRRIRYDNGDRPTLSYTGNSRAGSFVSLTFVGEPGATVEHHYSLSRRQTPQGGTGLDGDVTRVVLGTTDENGQLVFTVPLPIWAEGETIYHQGLLISADSSRWTPVVAEPVYARP